MTKRFAMVLVLLVAATAVAQVGPIYISEPVVPSLSPPLRDLPDYVPDPALYGLEAKRRDDHGFVGPSIDMPPHGNPLVDLQAKAPAPQPNAFGTPVVNFAGVVSGSSPPDDTGDVSATHFIQGDNGSGGSRITIYNKTGTILKQVLMETLGSLSPCTSGYCDPVVQYDELADRWFVSEFDSSGNTLCLYVSRTNDPLGAWWVYAYDSPNVGMQDYPKYGVWPDGYYMSANNGGWIIAMKRSAMLAGTPATFIEFNIGTLSGFGFQLTMAATVEGDAPPAGSPALYLRPRDTEIHGGTCSGCDLMEMWTLTIDWATPANSVLTPLAGVQMTDWDHTLCGTGNTWDCMPQPGTTQMIDPIREPLHYPLQYRNFGTHETLVGCFAEDVDGTDHAAVHWFEIRRTPAGSGSWVKRQEGVIGGEAGVHRSVCSAAMDQSGNIAVGYTRTGTTAPYYPSIYYSGRLAGDPLGTMPYFDYKIWDATTSKTNNERWGDYAGIGVDPDDDCTFWFTTEYGGTGQTRVAGLKFDQCGCLVKPERPTASAVAVQPSEIRVSWDDSDLATVTSYRVYRADVSGGPYTLVTTVTDSSPGVGNGSPYTYNDTPLNSGKTYYYVVDSTDGVACVSDLSTEVNATLYGTNVVYSSSSAFTELVGNMDGGLNQGEKWSVDVVLRNTGNLDATSVVASLAASGVTACASCAYGSIAAGGADLETCTFTFVIDDDFSTVNGCPADLSFGVVGKTCTEQNPAGLDEPGVFTRTVASGGMATANEAGLTGTIGSKTTTYFATATSPTVSSPGIMTACTIDVSMDPPGYSSWTLTVAIQHDPGNDGTYEFSHTIYSGTVGGWTNVTGHSVSTMVDGSNVGNGTWRLRVTNSGSGPSAIGTMQSWTLHLTTGSWVCSYTGAATCGAATAPEVSDDLAHALRAVKGTNPALVDIEFEAVSATHYQVYVSKTAATNPFLVTDTAEGARDCTFGGWTGPNGAGMLTKSGVSLETGITGSSGVLYFLITADNGSGTEGPLGFATGPVARTADSYCNK